MNRACGQLFSSAVFSGDQHRHIGFCGFLDHRPDVIDLRIRSENALVGETLLNLFAQMLILLNQLLLPVLEVGQHETIFKSDRRLIG